MMSLFVYTRKLELAEFLLHEAQQIGVSGCDGDGGGISAGDFLRERGAAQRADAVAFCCRTSAITSLMRSREASSNPFVALTTSACD